MAAVVLLLYIAAFTWRATQRGGGPVKVAQGANAPGADAPLAVAPARPASGVTSVALLADAPKHVPGAWTVTPDGARAPEGLGSAFLLGWPFGDHTFSKPVRVQAVSTPTIVFGRPEGGQAVVLIDTYTYGRRVRSGKRLYRYDLRRPPLPVGLIELKQVAQGELADISPDGSRLAIFQIRLDQGGGESDFSVFSTESGERIGHLPAPPTRNDHRVTGVPDLTPPLVRFLDNDHLAIFDHSQAVLEVWDAALKQRSSRVALSLGGPTIVTPGRGWIVGYTGDGFEWRRIPSGELGGMLRLPAALPTDRTKPAPAISPDGTQFAAYFRNQDKHILLAWDVATGTLRDAVTFPQMFAQTAGGKHGDLFLQWAGPRALFFAGAYLVDLDLHTIVWNLAVAPMFGKDWDRPRAGPDARLWRTSVPKDGKALWDELAAGNANVPERLADSFLLAGNPFPPALARYRQELHDDLILNCDTPVRIEAQSPNAEFRERIAKAAAESRWFKPYTIDPDAPIRLRVRIHPTSVGTSSKVVPMTHKLTGATINVTFVRPELFVKGTVEIADQSGAVRWSSEHVISANATIDPEYHTPERLLVLYPEAYDGRSGTVIETKYPKQTAEAREAFLKSVEGGIGGAIATDKAALRFPANEPVMRRGDMTIDGWPEWKPPLPPPRR